MMSKCLLIVVALGVACAKLVDIGCTEESKINLSADGDMFTYPTTCNTTTTITVHDPAMTSAMSVLFTNIKFYNNTPVADDAMFTITVKENTASATQPLEAYQTIIVCNVMDAMCMDRASKLSMASVTFESVIPMGETSGYGVMFNTMLMKKEDVRGYVDCRCAGAMDGTDGSTGILNVTIAANTTMMNLASVDYPCSGTWCMTNIMTDMDQAFNFTFHDIDSLTNSTTVPATLTGQMIDVYGNMMPVMDNQIFVNSSSQMTSMTYSSQFMLTLSVEYMSYAQMMNMSMMPQYKSSIDVTTVMQPMGDVMPMGKMMLGAKTTKMIMAPTAPYDYSDVVYQWEVVVDVEDKDTTKYMLGYEMNSCNGLNMNNMIQIRKTSSNGQIVQSTDSCAATMELKATSAGVKTVFVTYTRSNASLATGNWMYTLSTVPINSSSMTMASMVTVVLAAVIALFH